MNIKKIAVFLGDFFWSSIPYDGIQLFKKLQQNGFIVDLIMFDKDIRLNKKQFGDADKFYFDSNVFSNCNPIVVKNWDEFAKLSKDYSLVLSSAHIAPKTRYPHDIRKKMHPEVIWGVWDIGGADILTNTKAFANLYFVKGKRWQSWLQQQGISAPSFVTGSPHYDEYLVDYDATGYNEKYALKKSVLILPSNPKSHVDIWNRNIKHISEFIELGKRKDFTVCVKTYPFDYLHYEREAQYTGVYHRNLPNVKCSQWKMLKDKFPDIVVIDSQDHFVAMKSCAAIVNISSSHVSWESQFVKANSFTFELKDDYTRPKYLVNVEYPDQQYNINIKNCSQLSNELMDSKCDYPKDFILAENAVQNIVNVIKS